MKPQSAWKILLCGAPSHKGTNPGIAALIVLGAILFSALPAPAALAVEFTDPPGQNVERQEAALKSEVTRFAKSVIGGDLVEVVVDIGYAKTGLGGEDQIKLPGFNRYMNPSAETDNTSPEFLRVRQVFVMVSSGLGQTEQDSLKSQLISQLGFNRTKGDRLEVVPTGARGGQDDAPEGKGFPKLGSKRGLAAMPANEPESTVFLLRARQAYFDKDYEKSLRNILKALQVEPNSAQAYAMLGSVYFTLNWKVLAVRYWQRSLALDPDNKELEELVLQLEQQS